MPNKTNVSPIQVYKSFDFTGLTETNHLRNAMLTNPKDMGTIVSYAFGYQENNVMSLLTGGIGNTEYSSDREFTWNLHTQGEEAIEIGSDSPEATQATPGRYGMPVTLRFAKKGFTETDVLLADDNVTTVRVMNEPYQVGSVWEAQVQLTNPNDSMFIDPELLKVGARWSKEYSTVGEYSDFGGGTMYSTPIKLRNTMTTLRKTYKVTREAAQAVMIVELTSPDGKKTKMWTKLAEWTNMAAWYREQDRLTIYSEYNKDSKGVVRLLDSNQRPIYQGAGVRQQIAPANKRYYTKLTYDILYDFLLDLSYAANAWGGNHNFVALTGKMGMGEFDRAIKEYAAGNNITVTDSGTFITGSGSSLEFTGYFKTVEFLNGLKLTVKEFPPYDDIVRNRELDPRTGRPVESSRFTFLNFGNKNGKSNIRKVALTNSEDASWHVAGSTDPFGGVVKGIKERRSSGKDGYEVHLLTQFGVMVEDPLSCGELIKKVV